MAWTSDEYLAHHGILGQKWGQQNGPPYPLGAGDHSASERKAGWRRSLGGGKTVKKKKKPELTEEEKTAKRKRTALAVGTGLGALTALSIASDIKASGKSTTKKSADEFESMDALKAENNRLATIQTYNKLSGNKNKYEAMSDQMSKTSKTITDFASKIDVPKDTGPKYKRMKLDDVPSEELQKAINREQLERRYSELFGEEIKHVKSGEEKVKEALMVVGGVTTAAATILSMAKLISDMKIAKAAASKTK